MKQFIAKFEENIQGTLSGFDRVVFRGSLRWLTFEEGMRLYLVQNGVLCKQYEDHVKQVSQDLKQASLAPFPRRQVPIEHIPDPKANKEELARLWAAKQNLRDGDICALTAMELVLAFRLGFRSTFISASTAGNGWPAAGAGKGLRYSRQADCFPRIQDPQRAQSLLDEQLQVN